MTATTSDINWQNGCATCPRCNSLIEAEDIDKFDILVCKGCLKIDGAGYVTGSSDESDYLHRNQCPYCRVDLLLRQTPEAYSCGFDSIGYFIQIIRSPADLKYLELKGELA